MKNIHLIPTDKPSRLHLGKSGLVLCDLVFNPITINSQHIYITSDEEIKYDDWVLNIEENTIFKPSNDEIYDIKNSEAKYYEYCKKIILTTDPDLIADGVQAITDDFLEWFVKNPSCESVDVNDWIDTNGNIAFGGNIRYQISCSTYKEIILPQEEPKQEYKYIGECNGNNDNGCFLDSPAHDCGCFTRVVKDEPKQQEQLLNFKSE
jgi:hypothetical protein